MLNQDVAAARFSRTVLVIGWSLPRYSSLSASARCNSEPLVDLLAGQAEVVERVAVS